MYVTTHMSEISDSSRMFTYRALVLYAQRSLFTVEMVSVKMSVLQCKLRCLFTE